MIKIEIDKEQMSHILDYHSEYIQQVSVPRLDQFISEEKFLLGNQLIQVDQREILYIREFLDGNEGELEHGLKILCVSEKIDDIIRRHNEVFKSVYISLNGLEELEILKKIKMIFDYILDYSGFNIGDTIQTSSGEKLLWNRHNLLKCLGVRVCPYCNRQYITLFQEDNGISKSTADVDHYYLKSKYPFLQMNIFNMIPSCGICNSKLKGKKDKKHLYPYVDSSDNIIFKIPLDTQEQITGINVERIDVVANSKRAEISNEVFRLDKVYQAHINVASEVKRKYMDFMALGDEFYQKVMGMDFISNPYNLWFDFIEKNVSEEPLLKLKQDIFEQLKN